MKSSLTNSDELDALRTEYRRLQQLVQEARRSLEALQKEQADLQAEVDRLRLMREQNEHKLRYVSICHLLGSYLCSLYCTVLYCTVLYCTVLYCTVLYCTVLYCTVLYC